MHVNRLGREKSPYLLQHAHNPVDWYPWGEEAFAKARRENKPIFLSVGYSTCHWCHVMAHESFESEAIAGLLNESFVSIKVDREERPDVDRVYMTFVQAITGGGGWPMSVWLTPDLKPFFGGTYYTPDQFKQLLTHIADSWRLTRDQIVASGDSMVRQLSDLTAMPASRNTNPDAGLMIKGYEHIKASYEPHHGGFGSAPKFPRPVACNFMLRYYMRTGSKYALDMTLFTLRKMADGGIHDHIGGGFHRYSVDTRWHVPHFEKMLYDQAQLACSYLEAFQITHEALYADVAGDILDYVLRDMTGQDGRFYSAEDADSPLPSCPAEHAEGAFYVWENQELVAALGNETAGIFNHHYGVEQNGNVPVDSRGEFRNKNILIVCSTFETTGRKFGKSADETRKLLASARLKLREIRARRPRPSLDDKTLTSWNSLMISAFARGYQVLEEPRYLAAAQKATVFIESQLYDKWSGRLFHCYRGGETAISGNLDDYAFFIQALLDLYEASFDIRHLTLAVTLQERQDELFWDKNGGYFSGAGEDPSIILNMKEGQDWAEPSANSISALNLLRLERITDSAGFILKARKVLEAFTDQMQAMPGAMPQMLVALGSLLDKPKQIIIAGKPGAPDTRAMLRAVHSRFIPNKILLLADGGAGQETLAGWSGFIKDMKMLDGRATAFVCENNTCKLPTSDVPTMIKLIMGEK